MSLADLKALKEEGWMLKQAFSLCGSSHIWLVLKQLYILRVCAIPISRILSRAVKARGGWKLVISDPCEVAISAM